MELIFHKSEKYIKEDIFYYISDQRDKHSMIKPKEENLISMSVDSENFSEPSKKKITNIFYPFEKNSIDKIYIGLSFPLFSNNWGASYLRYLLKIIKIDGSIILPVYPEEQAAEKGMWSRSFLENIFTSRTGWTGRNNVWAENDGVMSIRIGKKFPNKINSTLNYYLEEMGNTYYREKIKNRKKLIENIWSTSKFSAILEKIIQDNFENKKITFCDIGNNPSIAFEINASNYIKIKNSFVITENNQLYNKLYNYFHYRIKNKCCKIVYEQLKSSQVDIIFILYNENNLYILNQTIQENPNSIVVFFGILDKNNTSYSNYKIHVYSSIVAVKLDSYKIINHYSDTIEEEINKEKGNNTNKIYVLIPN